MVTGMRVRCPDCGTGIPPAMVSVGTGVARCEVCNTVHPLRALQEPPSGFSSRPPRGSRIQGWLDAEGGTLTLPAPGAGPDHLRSVAVAAAWLALTALWTSRVAAREPTLALLSLPLWAAGVIGLGVIARGATEAWRLHLGPGRWILEKRTAFGFQKTALETGGILSIALEPGGLLRARPTLVLRHVDGALRLTAALNDDEQRWLLRTLRAQLRG